MGAVRFACGDASVDEAAELAEQLAVLEDTEIRESGQTGGAPFAEAIVVVVIATGGPIVYDAVKTFAKWIRNRKSSGTDEPITVIVRGLKGSCTITLTADADLAGTELAGVGTVTDLEEAR